MAGVPADPASAYWEQAAAVFLRRVIAARGGWYGTRIADPSADIAARLEQIGYDPFARDDSSARHRDGLNARDRWRRSFVRAVYRLNDTRNGGPGRTIQLEVGRRYPQRGLIPPGRFVRARTRRGGTVAARAAKRLPEGRQWAHGGGAASDTSKRDWIAEPLPPE